jgi:hypothetical protein
MTEICIKNKFHLCHQLQKSNKSIQGFSANQSRLLIHRANAEPRVWAVAEREPGPTLHRTLSLSTPPRGAHQTANAGCFHAHRAF